MIFVDCHLPGLDGIDLIRELRRQQGSATTRIVMLSGTQDPGARQRALDAGADCFERKSGSVAELRRAVVAAALRQSESPRPEIL